MTEIWNRIRRRHAPEPTDQLTCREIVELVTAYLEDELESGDRRRFEDHLARCQGCTGYLDQMRETVAIVGRIEVEDLPGALQEELVSAFRDWPRG